MRTKFHIEKDPGTEADAEGDDGLYEKPCTHEDHSDVAGFKNCKICAMNWMNCSLRVTSIC